MDERRFVEDEIEEHTIPPARLGDWPERTPVLDPGVPRPAPDATEVTTASGVVGAANAEEGWRPGRRCATLRAARRPSLIRRCRRARKFVRSEAAT